MKKVLYVLGFAVIAGCSSKGADTTEVANKVATEAELVARGMYLVTVAGCPDCHSPKVFNEHGMQIDKERFMSGHPEGTVLPEIDTKALNPGHWVLFSGDLTAAVGPWGITYAKNLTPDETGIKGWTSEVFTKAMRTGKHMGLEAERPIMPPMPWENVAKMTDEDLNAVFTYLQSLKPVKNIVPNPKAPNQLTIAKR